MRAAYVAVAVLIASGAEARIIDWRGELERCRALRENVAPLLLAGQGTSGVARSAEPPAAACGSSEGRRAREFPGAEAR